MKVKQMSENHKLTRPELVRTVTDLTELYIDRFSEIQFQIYGTLVGVTYHFDGDFFLEQAKSNGPYSSTIPLLFETELALKKPKNQVPESISPFAHFNQLFLLNQDYLDQTVLDILKEGKFPYLEEAKDHLSDGKLLRQAARDYNQAVDNQVLHESADFIDFLLSYNVQRSLMQSKKGSYQHLLGRLFFRFGEENFEDRLFSYQECAEVDKAARTHILRSAEHQAANISEDLSNLARRFSPQKAYLPPEPSGLEGDYRVKIPGLHRIKVPGGDGTFDWAKFAKERRDYQTSVACFGPEDILTSRVRNFLTESALEMIKGGSSEEEILAELNGSVENSSTGQNLVTEVMDTVRIINSFDDFESIHHQMPVTIIKDR
jgi:hypothetical protein